MSQKVQAVGVITSKLDFDHFIKNQDQCDVIEIRLDLIDSELSKWVLHAIQPLKTQKILTLRGTEERGLSALTPERRWNTLIEKNTQLQFVEFIDFEIQSLNLPLSKKITAEKGETKIIGSYHNFDQTPSIDELKRITQQGLDFDCDIIKMAVQTHSLEDLETLSQLMRHFPNTSFSLMGMGEIGGLSRHYFISKGSVLNYGYLSSAKDAIVPGQLPAQTLQQLIEAY